MRSAAAPGQTLPRRVEPFAVETEAVDDGLVLGQPKQARTGIALLRLRHHSSEFHEAKTERQELVGNFALLVEARRKSNGVRKLAAEHISRQTGIVLLRTRGWHQGQALDGQLMGRLGIERMEHGFRQGEERADHGTGSGNM
jgi:hypothetical protein